MCAGGDTEAAERAEEQRRKDEEDRQFLTKVGTNEVNRIFGNLVMGADRPAVFEDPNDALSLTSEDRFRSALQRGGDQALFDEHAAVLKRLSERTGEDEENFYGGVIGGNRFVDNESARKEIIREGERRGTFSFDDSDFLDELETAFLSFATPEIDRQFKDANETLTQQLARRGTLESSIAADKFADLERQRGEALSRAATRAKEIRSQRIADLEKARTNIIAQLASTGDTASAAQSALNATQAARATDTFEPLGNVFDVGLSVGADVLRQQSDPFAPPTIFSRNRGSGKVIGDS